MEWTAEEINRINKLILTASDQLYGGVWQGMNGTDLLAKGGTTLCRC